MNYNEMRPPLLDTGNGLEDRFATTPSTSEYTAQPYAEQVPTRTVFWVARRGRVSLAHAAALVEANRLGGVV